MRQQKQGKRESSPRLEDCLTPFNTRYMAVFENLNSPADERISGHAADFFRSFREEPFPCQDLNGKGFPVVIPAKAPKVSGNLHARRAASDNAENTLFLWIQSEDLPPCPNEIFDGFDRQDSIRVSGAVRDPWNIAAGVE